MNNGIRSRLILIFAVAFMAGCGQLANPGHPFDGQESLRVRTDAARGRIWVLGPEGVRVYDTTKRLIRQVRLPNWMIAQFICDPDMVLDRSGSAIISSNMQARLWRIDTDTFEVKEHEIRLHGKEGWDVGFGALAFAADGTLFAVTSSAGSLWRIDVGKGSARMLAAEPKYLNMCELSPRFMNDFERKQP
jgi:sugar lactone lactonase YvrE